MTSALLIDTHFYLWLRIEPQELTLDERNALAVAQTIWLSAASVWEVAMLLGAGRLPNGDARLLSLPDGIEWLAINSAHCRALAALPRRQHRDPFDRMLVAQAQSEGLTLMSRDQDMQAYRQYVTILP